MIIGCCVYATGTFMEKSDPSVHNYHYYNVAFFAQNREFELKTFY